MKYWIHSVFGCVALLTTVSSAVADVVAVLGSGTSPILDSGGDGDPLDIDLGTFNEHVTIRIYDEATDSETPPGLSVGTITISGTAEDGARVFVLIANSSIAVFPESFTITTPIAPGVVNLGDSGGGIIFGSTTLRDASVVAIAATGDLTGSIDCGKAFRVQSGGTIASNITAYGINDTGSNPSLGQFAINVVTAADGITGNIIAAGDTTFDPESAATWASIGRVIVGPQSSATGIRGDIKAEKGEIYTIFTTGPIGTESIVPEIWCADRLIEIRAVSETDTSDPLVLTFNADIRAGLDFVPIGQTNDDGAIHLIETDGAVTGYIKAANLGYGGAGGGIGTAVPSGGLWGIIAKGPITADIDVDYNMEYSNIIGSSITGTIDIGMMAKGTIVATAIDVEDPDAGRIESVTIGYAIDPPELYVQRFPRGMSGVSCDPINSTSPAVWYTVQCVEAGTHDSVIRAEDSIGEVVLRSMTQIASLYPDPTPKHEVPRVEAPQIQTLIVDDMRAGVVWSGKMEFSPNEPDSENDYAEIHNVLIGCVGPSADVWVVNCAGIDITHDLLGELHLPTLEADEVIRIGDRIGDGPDAEETTGGDVCQCGVYSPECFYTEGTFEEDSPRDTGYADKGSIIIREVAGLKGQIIINRNNTELAAGTGWKGTVVIGADGVNTPIVLGPGESQPHEAPYYEMPSSEVGGGAVGLVPFAFYPTDCTPPFEDPDVHAIPYDEFEGGSWPVRLRWYGPVKLANGYGSANSLLGIHCQNPADECHLADLSGMFNFSLYPSGQARAVGLATSMTSVPKDGIHIIHWDDASTALLACDDIAGDETFVGDFPEQTTECAYEFSGGLFRFKVDGDCNGNDVPDSEEILNSPDVNEDMIPDVDDDPQDGILDECVANPTCAVDWNDSGVVDVADIFAFLTSWFAECDGSEGCETPPDPNTPPCYCKSADFNGIDDISVPDIFEFLSSWFAQGQGPCS